MTHNLVVKVHYGFVAVNH